MIERLQGDPPSPYEIEYGYSRVVRAGDYVRVGGTTSVTVDGIVIGETPYDQAAEIFAKLLSELRRGGADPEQVIEIRMYVTDISRGEEVARAYREAFGTVRPVTTMVEVSALFDPRMLVEIEAVAYIGD